MQRPGLWRDGAGAPSQFPAAALIVAEGAEASLRVGEEVIEAPAVD